MRVYLDQIGCRLNYSEMETLAQQLREAGHYTVAAPEMAQVIIFNTCAVTREAGRVSRQRIRRLHRSNPAARIVATGCWTTLNPNTAGKLPGVAMVADNTRKELLAQLLEPWSADLDDPDDLARMDPDGTPFSHTGQRPAQWAKSTASGNIVLEEDALRTPRTRAFIKVQDGCNNRCTFCVVTLARGESRSRPLGEIVAEVQALVEDGVQEAVLTGVHLGSYGRDLDGGAHSDLKELTAALLAETDLPRLRLSSLEPWELAPGFFDLWATYPDRLCPHLHLPLQAGTDQMLRRMARRCTTDSFRELVVEARAAIPDLVVTTDLIVGFPGESDGDFAAGLDFVEEMRFADAHIFPFSARQGTAAASFDDPLPKRVKQARSRRMHALIARTGAQERQRFLHQARPVLWEQLQGDLSVEQAGAAEPMHLWRGFTDNYLPVMAEAPVSVNLHNRITPVQLDGLEGETFRGRMVDSPLVESTG